MIVAEQKPLAEIKTLIRRRAESAGRRLRHVRDGVLCGRRA